MKKIFTFILLTAASFTSAQDVPTSFPRKFLIEHFTGDGCGYCPGGMYAITNYLQEQNSSAIWVSHHYGYNNDEYTIPESAKIGNAIGVKGAPNMALNRTKQMGTTIEFHPGYLPEITIKDDTVAEASVVISHTYNAETRQLDITVSGQVANTEATEYLLSVLIKENRLVGKQADYDYSYKGSGWKEYMHARVIRDFVTAHFGDTVQVENQAYSHTLTYTIAEEWVPENCCVVAYLTPLTKKPIINAEQAPLVEGTTGGEEFYPYGIEEKSGPNKSIEFDSIQTSKVEENKLEILLISSKSVKTNYGPTKTVGIVYLNTEADSLQAGIYPVCEGDSIGTITAGYRIDEQRALGGSLVALALSNYLTQGIISVAHMWRIKEGEMTVEENGDISFVFTTFGGTKISAIYETPEVAVDNVFIDDNNVQKILRNGHLIIIKDGKEYDIMGNIIMP